MKSWILSNIENFIRQYEKNTVTKWGPPIVGFALAEKVSALKDLVDERHGEPFDVMEDAKIVISYFVPFLKELADTNKDEGLASPQWAESYEETNVMLGKLNEYLISLLEEKGYKAAVHPNAATFDRDKLISYWSHRHIAYLAGLGTFGINNMLITEKGCCGRLSTVVTNLDVVVDVPQQEERCLYKKNGTCKACIIKCPTGALTTEGFDKEKCYSMCMKNADIYNCYGNSYSSEDEDDVGSEVCGKCVAGMPCAFL